MVVIALMGMLASLATMSIHGVIVRQRLSRAAEVVEQFDTALRRSALVQRRDVTGVIDRNRHRLFVDSDAESPMTFKLPNHVEIGSVRYGSSNQSVRGNRVTFNEQGVSPSYAVRLDSGTNQRWVLLVGGTGQIVHDLDRGGVEAVLEGR
ncbi:MAG: hypothetical protein KDB00_24735 [Planctomycetales bacterium]|nr:hypothetical protein [Planctomycetales bacterium]